MIPLFFRKRRKNDGKVEKKRRKTADQHQKRKVGSIVTWRMVRKSERLLWRNIDRNWVWNFVTRFLCSLILWIMKWSSFSPFFMSRRFDLLTALLLYSHDKCPFSISSRQQSFSYQFYSSSPFFFLPITIWLLVLLVFIFLV